MGMNGAVACIILLPFDSTLTFALNLIDKSKKLTRKVLKVRFKLCISLKTSLGNEMQFYHK